MPVLKQHNSHCPVRKAGNPRPASNSPIRLKFFLCRVIDDMLNPLILDPDSVRTLARVLEVFI